MVHKVFSRALLGTAVAGSLYAVIAVLTGCTDDDTPITPDTPTADAGPEKDSGTTPKPDATTPVDAGNDSGNSIPDAGNEPDADAGPQVTVTEELGSTGLVNVTESSIQGQFWPDDTFIQSSDAPECVAFVRSTGKGRARAGDNIQVAGTTADGTAPQTYIAPVVTNSLSQLYVYRYLNFVYPAGSKSLIQVEKPMSFGAFAALPIQSLTSSPAAPLVVTKPALTELDGGGGYEKLEISKAADYELAWTAPDGTVADHQLSVEFFLFTNVDTAKEGHLYCSYPLSAGTATVKKSILKAFGDQFPSADGGSLFMYPGGHKLFKTNTPVPTAYVIRTYDTARATDFGNRQVTASFK